MTVRRRTALAAGGGLMATALFGCSTLRGPGSARGDESLPARYTYGAHPSQFAEISLPAGTAAAPVVVIVHGGFWLSSFGLELGRPLAKDLITRGFATVNVEYRRVGAGGGWPQTGQDVAAAVDVLASEGQRLAGGRLALDRVAGLGHSAGGHLAGWLAARDSATVPLTGLVAQAGVLDLVLAAEQGLGGAAVANLLGGMPAAIPAVYADASPIARVPLGIPSVCVHGRADALVPIEQSQRFVTAASAAGDDSRVADFDGDHFEPITLGTPAWSMCVDALTGQLS